MAKRSDRGANGEALKAAQQIIAHHLVRELALAMAGDAIAALAADLSAELVRRQAAPAYDDGPEWRREPGVATVPGCATSCVIAVLVTSEKLPVGSRPNLGRLPKLVALPLADVDARHDA